MNNWFCCLIVSKQEIKKACKPRFMSIATLIIRVVLIKLSVCSTLDEAGYIIIHQSVEALSESLL